jgi:hypothetical protein
LQRESHLHAVPAPLVDKVHVRVIEEEHALQVSLRRAPRIPAVPSRLIICQELNRHRAHGNGATTPIPPEAAKPLQVHALAIEPHMNHPGR